MTSVGLDDWSTYFDVYNFSFSLIVDRRKIWREKIRVAGKRSTSGVKNLKCNPALFSECFDSSSTISVNYNGKRSEAKIILHLPLSQEVYDLAEDAMKSHLI